VSFGDIAGSVRIEKRSVPPCPVLLDRPPLGDRLEGRRAALPACLTLRRWPMRLLCSVLAVGLLCLPAQAQDKKNAEKLVGTWVVSKSKQVPPGTTLEFTKDGKLKVAVPVGEMTIKVEGTYKVEGKGFKTTMKGPDGKEKTDTVKIKELTDKKLVTENDKGEIDEFTKKK
jgi:uncharacterized protein (TIGR03066 family)